jgi:SAM-dependent methyltransferase
VSTFAAYALYYDRLYREKDYRAEAAFVLDMVRKHCSRVESLLELGCGTAAHAEHLSGFGMRVHGVDRSPEMLEMARARQESLPREVAQRMSFSQGDVRKLRTGETFDAVISLFHVVSYQVGNEELRQCFATARQHLKHGGVFVFDCWYGPAVLNDPPQVRVKRWEDDGVSITRIAEPEFRPNQNVVDVKYTVFVRNRSSKATEVFEELHRMRYLFQPEVEMLAAAEKLELTEARAWMRDAEPCLSSWNACFVLRA